MASYCSEEDVKAATSRWSSFTATSSQRVDQAIINASAFVDRETEQWFDNRSLTVKTQPMRQGQCKLFMPANVISVSSVTESGVAITVSTGIVIYKTWLEKSVSSNPALFTSPLPWVKGQLNISVVGHFGFASVPGDIVQATAHIAGMIIGMVERTSTGGDGLSTAKLMKELPSWVIDILVSNKKAGLNYQPYMLT